MKNKTFEEAMQQEISYRYAAIAERDYHSADYFHEMRWRCMDAAVRAIEE